MRTRKFSLRALLSAFLALVFAIAAEPGAMAMPAAPTMPAKLAMHCADMAMPGCDHSKLPKDKETPCKTMALCAGMMGCFGMAAIAADHPVLRIASKEAAVHFHPQTSLGLTLQPDNPPPIA